MVSLRRFLTPWSKWLNNERKIVTIKVLVNHTTKLLLNGAFKAPIFCSHILYIKAKQTIFSACIWIVAAATGANYLIHVRMKACNLPWNLSLCKWRKTCSNWVETWHVLAPNIRSLELAPRTADVFPVVAFSLRKITKIIIIFRRERSDDRKYVCGLQAKTNQVDNSRLGAYSTFERLAAKYARILDVKNNFWRQVPVLFLS